MYLPKMKNTEFSKSPDGTIFVLKWSVTDNTDIHYRAYYLFADGIPKLIIQRKDKKSELFENHLITSLDIYDLVNREMIRGVRNAHQINNLVSKRVLSTA